MYINKKDSYEELYDIIMANRYKNILVAADSNTYAAAGIGARVAAFLRGKNVNFREFIFNNRVPALVPDETAVGRLIIAADGGVDFIIGIGSGVINDLCRYCAYRIGAKYAIIATAASMDGYLSGISPLIINGAKVTYPAMTPSAVLTEPALLASAPRVMTAAGFGDIIGKVTSSLDWKISSLLFGEKYIAEAAEKTAEAVKICRKNIDSISSGGEAGVCAVMDALALSGEAMADAGNSRPASGAEHHLAHFWEMTFLRGGKDSVLHGILVAAAALAVIRIYKTLVNEAPDFGAAVKKAGYFSPEDFKNEMREQYREAAERVISEEFESKRLFPDNTAGRIKIYEQKWPEIIDLINKNIPAEDELENELKSAGRLASPVEIGISREAFRNGVVYAMHQRQRFTVLQILRDLGLIGEYADSIAAYYYK